MTDRTKGMKKAWEIKNKEKEISFSECLHRAWMSAKAIPVNDRIVKEAKKMAGVEEETNTWYGWKKLGYVVKHGSKSLFNCELIYASKGDGQMYKAYFFGKSQVEAA